MSVRVWQLTLSHVPIVLRCLDLQKCDLGSSPIVLFDCINRYVFELIARIPLQLIRSFSFGLRD